MSRILRVLLSIVILCGVLFGGAALVSAKSSLTEEEMNMFSQNNITFYEPCNTLGGASGDCGITVSGATIEEKIWSGLTSFLTEEQAAGVMGNMAHEGGFNPARHETAFINSRPNFPITTNTKDSYGIGLIQWSFGRRVKVLKYISEKARDLLEKFIDSGRDVYGKISGKDFLEKAGDDSTNQLVMLELCFLKQELENNSNYGGLMNTSSIDEVSDYFLEHIEIPGDITGQRPIRRADAHKYYDEFHGKSISGDSGLEGDSDGAGDPCDSKIEGSKNINGAAVALAWPFGTEKEKYSWNGGTGTELFNDVYPKLTSKGARQSYKGCDGPIYGASCDRFVATAVRYSGYDKHFPTGVGLGERSQGGYPLDHPDLWERINWDGDPAELKAGDVVLRSGHVAIAVQDESGEFYIAEAGLCHTYGHIRKIKKKENFDYIIRATQAKNSNVGVSVKDGVKTSSTTGTLTSGTGQGNSDINASAIELAWPEGEGSPSKSATSRFQEVFATFSGSPGSGCWKNGKSCSVFVNTVLLYAGAQKGNRAKSPGAIVDNMIDRTDEWMEVGNEETLKHSDLKGGDVIVYYRRAYNEGNESSHYYKGLHTTHIAIYVETPNGGRIAEASYCNFFGKINKIDENGSVARGHPGARVFRWKKQAGASSCDLCNGGQEFSDSPQLKAGGMNLQEAKAFMKAYHDAAMGKYYRKFYDISFQGAKVSNAGCPYGVMNNCVAFSQWFVNKYTTIGPNWIPRANGVGVVNKLASGKGLKKGASPRPYAIFSNASWSYAGHTGVVLGVDEVGKKIVVGEASCSNSGRGLNYEPQAKEYSFDYIKKNNWTFVYTDDVISMGGQLKNV